MKIETQDGEFYHKALFRDHYIDRNEESHWSSGWSLSTVYFSSKKEALEYFGHDKVVWPADCIAEGVVYIPAEEEL